MSGFVLENVRASYDGQCVFTELNCRFDKGTATVILGPSGIGKTTLLRLLLGLKRPVAGTVAGAGSLRCGTVFQEDRLLETASAVRNIRLVCREEAIIREHLTSLGIPTAEQDKPVSQLSGGQRRRVALVRAVLFESDFLLLDEPFKGLDADTAALTKQYVLQNIEGRGLVLVTHDPLDAAFFNAAVFNCP